MNIFVQVSPKRGFEYPGKAEILHQRALRAAFVDAVCLRHMLLVMMRNMCWQWLTMTI